MQLRRKARPVGYSRLSSAFLRLGNAAIKNAKTLPKISQGHRRQAGNEDPACLHPRFQSHLIIKTKEVTILRKLSFCSFELDFLLLPANGFLAYIISQLIDLEDQPPLLVSQLLEGQEASSLPNDPRRELHFKNCLSFVLNLPAALSKLFEQQNPPTSCSLGNILYHRTDGLRMD
ncbi:uncharacterized protein LOC116091140 isoform X2 [Mastomys coucha]|uniref:uncharacterized protein LOC116091140 isoform X2 n=1 Tax=Mastomys coucha TaxID=35658 RepID=UPI001261C556|nr:uncharacterized protein LOC116091140 isoform X2 [Mastomys coucha]